MGTRRSAGRRLCGQSTAVVLLATTVALAAETASAQPGPGADSPAAPPAAEAANVREPQTVHPGEPQTAPADGEIDRFMARVFANRKAASWRRLGDFVLRETFSVELDAPAGTVLSGFRRVREYEWYVRGGTAVRSPVRVDGVGIDEATRRDYERSWLREEERRRAGRGGDDRGNPEARDGPEARGARRGLEDLEAPAAPAAPENPESREPREDPEPRFLTDFFYFLEWGEEPGDYYFVGRETVAGREVLRIEFYPTAPFWKEAGERINRGVAKTSMVTLWVDLEAHQIVQYAFENAGLDFLRFRWLLRAEGLRASMELAPFRGVWMPARMTLSGTATTALGAFGATVTQEFFDYRQAETGAGGLTVR